VTGGTTIAQTRGALAFRAVATDLDGTLLRSDLTVSERSRRALAAASARETRHVVVTGRQPASCRRLVAPFGYRGVAVCSQGAQVYDLDSGRLVWSTTLDRTLARAAVAAVVAEVGDVSVGVATAGLDGRILLSRGFYSAPGAECEVVEPEQLWSQPVERVLLRRRPGDAASLADEVVRVCGDAVTAVCVRGEVVELLPPGVTKAQGLAAVADLLGFSPAETIAFGDEPSDLPMLEWAGYAVAMANAHERLRALADEVGPSNDEDGVAAVLERFSAGDSLRPRREADEG
jgi:Cof subfamily protein (haloacid dehalogenase superfamily)